MPALFIMKKPIKIIIPDSIKFSYLKLARDHDGMVSFDRSVIEQICDASEIDHDLFFNAPENNVSQLIVHWYSEHIKNGGDRDPVADDLIAETLAEDESGGGISHPPGSA